MSWLDKLINHAEQHPIIILRFEDEEWDSLSHSQRGVNEFTIARSHDFFKKLKVPAPCLIIGKSEDEEKIFFGLVSSKSAVTTLESRIKVSRAEILCLKSKESLIALVTKPPHAGNFESKILSREPVSILSPKLSGHLIERLASFPKNKNAMQSVAAGLTQPRHFNRNQAMQDDAVRTALGVFGLESSAKAISLHIADGKETVLGRVTIMEDAVIEHDARSIPGFKLTQSDVTGRALFENGNERLEVFTANRRELEHCLGVDLIYVNLTMQNIVMLQYKMLEPTQKQGDERDWIYRPDDQLDKEISRMKTFSSKCSSSFSDYRMNSEIFYLKFVKRDAARIRSAIITPLDHFEKLRNDPEFKGDRGGLRLSYNSLNGHYLRQDPFLHLVRCGYIGSNMSTTAQLLILIKEILDGNEAVILAIQHASSDN